MKEDPSLDAERDALQEEIRRDAANAKLRIHLFQLLCVRGDWQRALAQLQICGQMDAKALAMAQTYREAIRIEGFRREVFAGRRAPQVMGKPPQWIGLLIDALRLDGTGDLAAAAKLRQQAMDLAEPNPCQVDDVACEWLADGDSRLGPVCEIIANGQYYWLPFESCGGISLDAPADLRDVVWAAGEVLLPAEGRVPVLIPARYPGTDECVSASADQLKRGRLTEWTEPQPGQWHGIGQRMWVSDVGEHPILDTRRITAAVAATAV